MDPAQKIDLPKLPYPEQKLKTHFGDIDGIGFTESQMRAYGEACARIAFRSDRLPIESIDAKTADRDAVTVNLMRLFRIDKREAREVADFIRGVPAGHVVVPGELEGEMLREMWTALLGSFGNAALKYAWKRTLAARPQVGQDADGGQHGNV